MRKSIERWCYDHKIELPEDRIEMLETMIRSEEANKVSILQDIAKWFNDNRFKEIEVHFTKEAFIMRVKNKENENKL